jgi:carbamoyl-phosphate synthase large subunit
VSERILIVGCGFPQLGLLRFCLSEGLSPIGIDADPGAVGAGLCERLVPASTTDVDAIVVAARELRVAGLTTCGSDHALLPTAIAAERLGLPFYASSETLRACTFKDEMRAKYEAGRAPTPARRVVSNLREATLALQELGLPVVVKPVRGWGQRGVAVVVSEGELQAAVQSALLVASKAAGEQGARCLIEAFIDGKEYSVNAYTYGDETEVLTVTERIITGYPDPPGITFAEVYPSGLDSAACAEVAEAAVKGLRALGIRRGPTYTQVRHGERGAFLVETAHRLGGGLDPDVTFLASGVSLYRRIVGVALDRPEWETRGPEAPRHGGVAGRFVVGPPGQLRLVAGLDRARAMQGVVSAEIYVRPGERIHALTDGAKRAGHVLAFGKDRDEAEQRARVAIQGLHFELEAS